MLHEFIPHCKRKPPGNQTHLTLSSLRSPTHTPFLHPPPSHLFVSPTTAFALVDENCHPPRSFFCTGMVAQRCYAGEYWSNQERDCEPCDFPNTYSDGRAVDLCDAQPTCNPGQKISADTKEAARTCSPCPAGQYQSSPKHRMIECNLQIVCKGKSSTRDPGRFQNGGATSVGTCFNREPGNWVTGTCSACTTGFAYNPVHGCKCEEVDPEVVPVYDANGAPMIDNRAGLTVTLCQELCIQTKTCNAIDFNTQSKSCRFYQSTCARCAFFGRNLHSRMPLDPTHVRLKRTCV
jgi:hypothetical protein